MPTLLCLLTLVVPPTTTTPCHSSPVAVWPLATRGGRSVLIQPKKVKHLPEWMCIHQHEGAWTDETGNGYHGGLQFDRTFEESYGRDMLRKYGGRDAGYWTPRDQIIVAERAYESGRGFYPWPNTARACGYI